MDIYKYPQHRTVTLQIARQMLDQKGLKIAVYDFDTQDIVRHLKEVRNLN